MRLEEGIYHPTFIYLEDIKPTYLLKSIDI